MTDFKPRNNIGIDPLDLSQSYVDSSFNEGSVSSQKLNTSQDRDVFHPGVLGARTIPGEGGFNYADTPQATIFIAKKQWVEQEWTYVSNTLDERKGKIQETLTRMILGNLITRKLDLLNNHELFTKFSELNAASSSIEQSALNKLSNAHSNIMADVLTLAGSPVTKYYTETLKITSPATPEETKTSDVIKDFSVQIATSVLVVTDRKDVGGRLRIHTEPNINSPVLAGIKSGQVFQTTGGTSYGDQIFNVDSLPEELLKDPSIDPEDLKKVIARFPTPESSGGNGIGLWYEIDIATLKPTQLFLNKDAISGDDKSLTYDKIYQSYKKGYVLRVKTTTNIKTFNTKMQTKIPFPEKITLKAGTNTVVISPPVDSKNLGIIRNSFNGVMELANVTTITTNINNKGESGSATITLQNPNNLLYITEDDIEIAIGTREVDSDYLDSELVDGTTKTSKDIITGDNIELKYYNGKFYTQNAFNLVTRPDLSPMANSKSSLKINTLLTHIKTLKEDLANIQLYKGDGTAFAGSSILESLQAVYFSETIELVEISTVDIVINPIGQAGIYDPGYTSNQSNAQRKILQLNNRISSTQYAIDKLKRASTKPLPKNDTNSSSIKYIKSQLVKYFQNRTIFEVYDRIYIWTSSPTRSSFRLTDGTIVGESSNISSTQQIILRRIREIISIIKQINSTVIKNGLIQNRLLAEPYPSSTLEIINKELFESGYSETFSIGTQSSLNIPTDDIVAQSLIKATNLKMIELSILTKSIVPKGDQVNASDPTSLQGLDPAKLLEPDSFAGIEENQFQIFQGVISSVKRGYSEGVFTISISCTDNMDFLERSRFTTIPALDVQGRDIKAEMDDPIFRKIRNQKSEDKFKKEGIDQLAGRWKSGLFAATATVQQEKDEELQTQAKSQDVKTNSKAITELERRNVAIPFSFAFEQLFQGADPAAIISVLVTGVPFNLQEYVLNTASGGSIQVPQKGDDNKEKGDELVAESAFEFTRRQIQGQVKKMGNFEPFISKSTSNLRKEDKEALNLSSILSLGTAVVDFVVTYISLRPDLFSQVRQIVIKQQKQEDGQGIYNKITEKNINKLFDFKKEVFNLKLSEITLLKNSLNDAKLEYLVQAAINQSSTELLNKLLSNLTSPTNSKEMAQFKSFVPTMPDSTISQFYKAQNKYTLDSGDISEFLNISMKADTRVSQAVGTALLYDNKDQISESLKSYKSSSTSTLDLVLKNKIASLRGLKLGENGEVISGSPTQATKASIAFKQKPNFLIISDEYYKSPNLVDYIETGVANPSKYYSDQQSTVKERCSSAAKAIDWEFYCDTQGHIRFKQPTYNRTLLKHLLDFEKVDITIKTAFNQLFENNIKFLVQTSVYSSLSTAALDAKTKALSKLRGALDELNILEVAEDPFSIISRLGISTPSNVLSYMVSEKIISSDRIQEIAGMLTLSSLTPPAIASQASLPGRSVRPDALISSNIDEVEGIIIELTSNSSLLGQSNPLIGSSTLDYLSSFAGHSPYIKYNELREEYVGYLAFLDNKNLFKDLSLDNLNPIDISFFDTMPNPLPQFAKVAGETIESTISFILYCSDLITKVEQLKAELDGALSSTLEAITDQKFIHIITSAIIISEDYNETAPEYTRLNVHCSIPLIKDIGDEIAKESMQWAGMVDYDLWRNYGYKVSSVEPPFLRTASQALVYGYQLLARQYSKILTGSILVRGDSKYQLGDTVFIEDENLYFYIVAINHSFTYGNAYNTTLTLEYGRRPGYYIPYPFDVLGARMIESIEQIYQVDPTDIKAMITPLKKAQAAEDNT